MTRVSDRTWTRRPGLLLCAALSLVPGEVVAHGDAAPEAPSAEVRTARFEAPAPGSYELPPIQQVTEHRLLGAGGGLAPLLDPEARPVSFVSFVYRSCGQSSGCPQALSSFQRLDRVIAADSRLADRVRLVTVSFDPAHDTPERMAELRSRLAPRSDWRFFTATDLSQLAPVLADYGQDRKVLRDAAGRDTGQLRHVLKVFLVDGERRVRNVYSSGFLDLDLLRNDALTLLIAPGVAAGP